MNRWADERKSGLGTKLTSAIVFSYTRNSRLRAIRNLVRASLFFSSWSTHLPLIKSCNCFSISARHTCHMLYSKWLANWMADNETECIKRGIYYICIYIYITLGSIQEINRVAIKSYQSNNLPSLFPNCWSRNHIYLLVYISCCAYRPFISAHTGRMSNHTYSTFCRVKSFRHFNPWGICIFLKNKSFWQPDFLLFLVKLWTS